MVSDRFYGRGRGAFAAEMFERLEPRIVLAAIDGLPALSALELDTNPVVMFDTNVGRVFLELFPQDAPGTVANFLEYVKRGQYSESFFHRAVDDFVLQGGGFVFNENEGYRQIFEPDLGPIQNEFGRPNLERTIAMAKLENNPNSATSQFFFNLNDNPSLDTQNQGFTVFGRVLGEASWTVVQLIADLNQQDLSGQSAFAGQIRDRFGNPLFTDSNGFSTTDPEGNSPRVTTSAFTQVPIVNTFTGDVQPGNLVQLLNAQIVKTGDGTAFYTNMVVYPEGYASPTSTETLKLVNPHNTDVQVQVIARYEFGMRDTTLTEITIPANATVNITLHDSSDPENSLVEQFNPYALEVYSAPVESGDPAAIAASINRFDFGDDTGESFVLVAENPGDRATAWNFAGVLSGLDARSFIVWQNLTSSSAELTVTIFYRNEFNASLEETADFTLGANRRGGVDLSAVGSIAGLPANTLVSVRVEADREIAVAASSFIANDELPPRSSTLSGVPNEGARTTIIPNVVVPTGGRAVLSILNVGGSVSPGFTIRAFVETSPGNVATITPGFQLENNTRNQLVLNTQIDNISTIARDQPFTLFIDALSGRQFVTGVTVDYGTQSGAPAGGPVGGTAVHGLRNAATVHHFADSFVDRISSSEGARESISLYNPFPNQNVTVRLTYRFDDGSTIQTSLVTVPAFSPVNIRPEDNAQVLSKVDTDPERFANFSIMVESFEINGSTPAPIVASLQRQDNRAGDMNRLIASGPIQFGEIVPLTDARFQPGSQA
ncbi:MAG: peptidylprolyl isomerase [Phycisphaerales bacterium]|nr:peptidylprolyl isomerase [Phycisphaerales bacterium]